MTLDQAVEAHQQYLKMRGIAEDAREAIVRHLTPEPDTIPEIQSAKPRIVLVAADFSTELTTAVLWLNEVGLDIACVRLVPYHLSDKVLIDAAQVIPLSEATQYIIRLREKAAEVESTEPSRRIRTQAILTQMDLWKPDARLALDFGRLPLDYGRNRDDPIFHATFSEDVGRQRNVRWAANGETYSLSTLTEHLRDSQAVPLPKGGLNGFYYWCFADRPDATL